MAAPHNTHSEDDESTIQTPSLEEQLAAVSAPPDEGGVTPVEGAPQAPDDSDPDADDPDKADENEAEVDPAAQATSQVIQPNRQRPPMTAGATALAIAAGITHAAVRGRGGSRPQAQKQQAAPVPQMAERVRKTNIREATRLAGRALKQVAEVEAKVSSHDDTYRPLHNSIKQHMESPALQKRHSDVAERRAAAVREAKSDLPEFSEVTAEDRYKRSRMKIEHSVRQLANTVTTLGGKKLEGELDPKLQEMLGKLRGKLESETDSPFHKAARAATFDGQEDEGWRKKMEDIMKEAMKSIQAFFQSFLTMVGIKPKA